MRALILCVFVAGLLIMYKYTPQDQPEETRFKITVEGNMDSLYVKPIK